MNDKLIKALSDCRVCGHDCACCENNQEICCGSTDDLVDATADAIELLTLQNAVLQATISHVEAERDAAVELLRRLPESCCGCKYAVDGEACQCSECDDADTENCTEACPWWGDPCGLCDDKDSWSFCGAQGEG